MQNVPATVKRKSSTGEEEMRGEAMAVDEPAKSPTDSGTVKQDGPANTSAGGGKKKKQKGKR